MNQDHQINLLSTHKHMSQQSNIKVPAVAGYFYPADRRYLERNMVNALEREKEQIDRHRVSGTIIGGIVPHAGISYCSSQAVHFFELARRSQQPFDTVVIAHPNHYGYGPAMSVDGHEFWETPMGMAAVDTGFMDALNLPVSASAQQQEHSAEVIVPWIQHFIPGPPRIVPVNIRRQDPTHACLLAEKVYRANKHLKRNLLFVASTDFSHFLSPAKASCLDELVINEILAKNKEGMVQTILKKEISVCGYGPVMALMAYAEMIDPSYTATILRKGHSGEVSPSDKVVSYVSMLFTAPGI